MSSLLLTVTYLYCYIVVQFDQSKGETLLFLVITFWGNPYLQKRNVLAHWHVVSVIEGKMLNVKFEIIQLLFSFLFSYSFQNNTYPVLTTLPCSHWPTLLCLHASTAGLLLSYWQQSVVVACLKKTVFSRLNCLSLCFRRRTI